MLIFRQFSYNYILLLASLVFCIGCSTNKATKNEVFPTKKGKARYIESYNNSLKLWDVPYEEVDLKTTYGNAHIIITGPKTGKQLILFSGTDASSTMWFPNIKALSKKYRCYAIDFPSEAGKTHVSQIDISNSKIAAFYREIFNHFHMNDINLVAVSRGGWVATYLALHKENNIKKLILLSPAQTFGGIHKLGKVFTALMLKAFPSEKTNEKFFKAFSNNPDKINPIFKEQLYLAYKYGNSKPRVLKMGIFSKKELSSIKIPLLLLVGDNDAVNSPKVLDKAKRLIPTAETALIPNAGHFVSVDQPEIVNKLMLDFLEKKATLIP